MLSSNESESVEIGLYLHDADYKEPGGVVPMV